MNSSPSTSITVLVVDDHRVLADALVEALRERFARVDWASSAEQAIEMAREAKPDVVLMDFRLPGATGTYAARQIKEHRPETQVVMLTSEAHDSVVLEAIEAGCSGYLLKSASLEEVENAVRAAAAGEALISAPMLAKILPKIRSGGRRESFKLSRRELEVLRLMAEGLDTATIAGKLFVSHNTVRNHIQKILQKLGAHSKLEAVTIATRTGVLDTH